jgi:mannosyltransferase
VSLTQPRAKGSRAPRVASDAHDVAPTASRALVAVALAATVAGIALRFVARTPLWLDEALSVNIAELPLSDIPDALRHDGHPPLYYVLLHGWMELFGQGDLAVRALSGVISVVTLPLAWVVGRRRGGPALGWIFLALLALAPFALRYATETRMYALVMLLVVVGYLLVDDVVRRGRAGVVRLVGIAVVGALLLYSHYWAIWLLAGTGGVLAWQAWRTADAAVRRRALQVLVAVAGGGVLFVPWLGVMAYQAANTGTPWAGAQRPTSVLAEMLRDYGGGGFADASFIGTVLAVLFLLGLFGRSVSGSRIRLDLRTERQLRYEAAIVGATLAFGVAASIVTASAFAPRYTAVIFPLFLMVVAGGLLCFADGWIRLVVLGVVLMLSAGGAYFNATDQRSQARDIAAALAERAAAQDLVVYCPDQLGPACHREMRGDLDQVVFPTFASPERVDWVDYAERHRGADPEAFAGEAAERAGSERGIFLVWNGDYRGVDDQCESVLEQLAARRPGAEMIVTAGAGDYFEFAAVVYFPPTG